MSLHQESFLKGNVRAETPTTNGALRFAIVLLPKFTLTAFSSFLDVIRLAADQGDRSGQVRCTWSVMSVDGGGVRSSCGVTVQTRDLKCDPKEFDYIVVVGGTLQDSAQSHYGLMNFLRQADRSKRTIVGLCTGSFAMVRAGIMAGHTVCVSWFHYQDFLNEFEDINPDVRHRYVKDGRRITCAGGAASAEVALQLIVRHFGHAMSKKCARILLLEEATFHGLTQPPSPLAEQIRDNLVRELLIIVEENLSEALDIDELASRLDISRRQLERRFRKATGKTIAKVILGMRMGHALKLVLHTNFSISRIAAECGVSGSSRFSFLFKRTFGFTPLSMRSKGRFRTVLHSSKVLREDRDGIWA